MKIVHWRKAMYITEQIYTSKELTVPDNEELVSKMVKDSWNCKTAMNSDKTICYGWTNVDTGEEHIVYRGRQYKK